MIENLTTIKNAIIDKLEAIDGLTVVYGYEKGELPSYPAACVFNADYNPEWADTTADRDVLVFTIHLYQEVDVQKPEIAEENVDNVLQRIMQAFQQDYTLGGTCDKMNVRASKGWTSREVQTRAATITLTAEKLNRII